MRAILYIAPVVMASLWSVSAAAQAVPTIPTLPTGPVTSNTAPSVPPINPTLPAGSNTGSAGTTKMSAQDIANAANAIKALDAIQKANGDPQQIAAALNQVPGLDLQKEIGKLSGILPGDMPALAQQGVGLDTIGSVISAAKNGGLMASANTAFEALKGTYQVPGLSPEDQNKIYGQLQQLQGVLASNDKLNAGLDAVKNNVSGYLGEAGLGSVVSALDDLANGRGNPEDIARKLASVDMKKLNETLAGLGVKNPVDLAKFLPPGTDPEAVGRVLGGLSSGGYDGLLAGLESELLRKLAGAPPDQAGELQGLLDSIRNQRTSPDGLGGLFGTPPFSNHDCKQSGLHKVVSGTITGSRRGATGLQICQ